MTLKITKYALHDFLGIPRNETFDEETWEIVRYLSKIKIPKGKYGVWLELDGKKRFVNETHVKEARLGLALLGWNHKNR